MTTGYISSAQVIIYFNPIFCPKFRFGWIGALSKNFIYISLLYHCIDLILSIIFCLFFWRSFSLFRYFCFIYNCLWTKLWWIFWDFCNLIVMQLSYCVSNSITNQITSCFSCSLNWTFWSSFNCICSTLF